MRTCVECFFYEAGITITKADGTTLPGGYCFGAPPTAIDNKSTYPSVRADQRECALWRAPPPAKAKPRSK